MEFRQVDVEEYKMKWKKLERRAIKTEPISLNPDIISCSRDFRKYFSHLIDIRAQSEGELVQISRETVLGGIFELDVSHSEYLLNISCLPNNTAVFQIASLKENKPRVRYLLQTLLFLFKS